MIFRTTPLLLFLFCCLNTSAQILKTDSTQKSALLNGLILKQKYKPDFDLEKVDTNDIAEMINKANVFYESENYAEAYKAYSIVNSYVEKQYRTTRVKHSEKEYTSFPLLMMAECEIRLDHEENGYMLLKKVIENDPANCDAYDALGILYLNKQEYDSAIVQLKQAIRINARFERAYYNLADVYQEQKDFVAARGILFKLINLNPLKGQYHLFMAYIHEQRKQFQDAEREYNIVVNQDPSGVDNYFYRGSFLLRQKKYGKAIEDFRVCYKRDSTNVDYLEGLTNALIYHSEYEEGIEKFYIRLNKMDISSASFKMNVSLVETRDVLTYIYHHEVNELERTAAIKILALTFIDAASNAVEIEKIASTFRTSEICQRLYFLSLYVGSGHEKFKYQSYRLYSINPKLPNSYLMEATLSAESNTAPKRIEAIKKAIAIDSLNPVYYYTMAMYMEYDDVACIHNIEKAIKLDPKFGLPYTVMGKIYELKKQYDSALYFYQLGMYRTRNKEEGYYLIGTCYLDMNRVDSSLVFLTKAIRLKAKSYEAYLARSSAFVLCERFDLAHRDIDSCLSLFPESNDVMPQRAYVFRREKKWDEALKIYSALIKKYPNNPEVYVLRGDVHQGMKNSQLALADYQSARAIWPYDPGVIRKVASVYLSMRDSSTARTYFKKALEMNKSGFVDDYMNSASMYTEVGYYDEAIKFYEYALKSDAKNVHAIGNIGWVYYKKGDFEKAMKYSKKAIAYDSTAMFAKYNLALCELRMGNIERAKLLYTEFTKQDIQMGHPKPYHAIEDIESIISLGIYATEGRYIIDSIIEEHYKNFCAFYFAPKRL